MRFFLPLLLTCLTRLASAAEVNVAVAANFMAPMQQIAAAFETETGHTAVLSFGSTGKLYAQIRNGAPFGMLLAADSQTPAQLVTDGLAQPGTAFTYAIGRLVLWSADSGRVDNRGAVLRNGPSQQRVAIADPRLAPYGKAAMQTLEALGLRAKFEPRLVMGESVAQTFQFISSGNAPFGFVALSQVYTDGRITQGSAWIVPERLHEPLRQDAVVLLSAKSNPAALALAKFLRGPTARRIIRAHGYGI